MNYKRLTKAEIRSMISMARSSKPFFRDCFYLVSGLDELYFYGFRSPFNKRQNSRFVDWAWWRGMKAKKSAILSRMKEF